MHSFDRSQTSVPCGHFIGGAPVAAPHVTSVSRPFDGPRCASLSRAEEKAEAETVDCAVTDAATRRPAGDSLCVKSVLIDLRVAAIKCSGAPAARTPHAMPRQGRQTTASAFGADHFPTYSRRPHASMMPSRRASITTHRTH